jgi:hypothetical protein
MKFPYDDLREGDTMFGRWVRFRGEHESDAEFGPWKLHTVVHVGRDKTGAICDLVLYGSEVGFDPRNDWIDGMAYPCLSNEECLFQVGNA